MYVSFLGQHCAVGQKLEINIYNICYDPDKSIVRLAQRSMLLDIEEAFVVLYFFTYRTHLPETQNYICVEIQWQNSYDLPLNSA